MKFSGKNVSSEMIILKVTISQGFTFCLQNTVLKKPQVGGQIDSPHQPFFVFKGII